MVIGVNCNYRYEFLTAPGEYTDFGTGPLFAANLVLGPDKRVWGGYCCNASGSLAAIDATGKQTVYPLPNVNEQVAAVTVGPDKNIWYATNYGIGKAVPATGKATDYNVGFAANSIASGSNGKIWFGNANAAQIGSIEPSGMGLSLFTNGISGIPHSMASGPDKNLYFSEYVPSTGQSALSRITMAGVVTEYALPYGFNPGGVSVGPDANIWTVDESHDQLGQLVL